VPSLVLRSLVQGMTNKIQDIYILRRTKDDLAKINSRLELPPCHFENVELDMFPDERQLYEFVFKDAQDTIKRCVQTCHQPQCKKYGYS
jgi:hypothetical protein